MDNTINKRTLGFKIARFVAWSPFIIILSTWVLFLLILFGRGFVPYSLYDYYVLYTNQFISFVMGFFHKEAGYFFLVPLVIALTMSGILSFLFDQVVLKIEEMKNNKSSY